MDDEEQILELLELTLRLHGYEILTAAGGPQALELFAAQRVDVIVMDVLMSPWDGFETVRQLHRAFPPLPPIVFLSGLNRPETLPDLGGTVAIEYLLKPFRPSDLIAVVERIWADQAGLTRES
ncbi:response regulator [Deinococcus sp.]|uniref:response regulator n=1 Tax=Deinococcus sp. TaxID=47478 RepID=UPI002869AE40|nr:response regulator [Deinococcus sp.]